MKYDWATMTDQAPIRRVLPLLLLAAIAPFMQGCVFWQIRDQVQSANTKLVTVDDQLQSTNRQLVSVDDQLQNVNRQLVAVDDQLQTANRQLGSVEGGLTRIDTANSSLSILERQLTTLDSMNKSMVRLDEHLAGLRKSLNALDSIVPFIDLGSGPVSEAPAPAEAAPAAAPGAQPSATPETSAQTPDQTARPDPFAGTWVGEHPTREAAIVILTDGRYFYAAPPDRATGAAVPVQRGRWTRTEGTYTFTPDAPAAAANAPAAAAVAPWTLETVSIYGRSASFLSGESLTVFVRR